MRLAVKHKICKVANVSLGDYGCGERRERQAVGNREQAEQRTRREDMEVVMGVIRDYRGTEV